MRTISCLIVISLLAVSITFAAGFSPAPLKISAPLWLSFYNKWDMDTFSFTVNLTGTDARVTFLIFTRDREITVQSVRNGYLGWHYVNRIDTCVYVAPPVQLAVGANTMRWQGRDENGNPLSSADYTYYLWGVADGSVKVRAAPLSTQDIWNNPPIIVQYDEQRTPVANPILWSKNAKWSLGSDPEDITLLETCNVTPPRGCTLGRRAYPQTDDRSYFFVEVGRSADAMQGVAKYKWVPSGEAEIHPPWGDIGVSLTPGSWGAVDDGAGVASEGYYLYTVTRGDSTRGKPTRLNVWDWQDGSLIKKFDISSWWDNPEEARSSGRPDSGPNTFSCRNDRLFLSSSGSCFMQMVCPILGMDYDDYFVSWANGNGDFFFDRNYEPDAVKKWECNDPSAGLDKFTLEADNKLFAIAPCDAGDAASFGLIAPDGTGAGYMNFYGESAGANRFDFICDNGSIYDGIYCNNASGNGDSAGIWYVAQDSFKGLLRVDWWDSVGDVPSSDFICAGNSPNPFNASTTIDFSIPKAGKVTVDVYNTTGQKVAALANGPMTAGSHSVIWNAGKLSAGLYFATVKSGPLSRTVKMTLLK